MRQFNGLVLSTERFTEIGACDSFDVTETQAPSVICCPTVPNWNVSIYPICNNPLCKKKEIGFPCWCNSCDVLSMCQEAFVKKPETNIKIYLQLENQDVQIATVTLFPPEITDIFGEETLKEAKGS